MFGSCVAAPVISGYAFQRGACANCIWDGKERSCSLRGENMLLDSTSVLYVFLSSLIVRDVC